MCGVFGYVGDAEVAGRIPLDRALDALRHRGPDGSGTFRDGGTAGAERRAGCALAHTRLSIIDLSDAGRQPMTTEDGRHTIVYNGEVYNFRELRPELEGLGVRFRSGTDTEVVLNAVVRWGAAAVERFRGMFAFAVWDATERTLLLGRDRLGIKPLYYATLPHGLAFASEVRALLAAGLVDASISMSGVESFLTYGSVREPDTILKSVSSLPPATTVEWSAGRLCAREYWTLPMGRCGADAPSAAAAEPFRALLSDAVAMRLVSDVALGTFLSGGIDSSAIVALASERSAQPLHTFTITFGEEPDERQHARTIAEQFGCVHQEVHLEGREILGRFEDALAAFDQPSMDGLNTYFVARAARQAGSVVALSGLGGDELFAGYPNFRRFGTLLFAGRTARPASGAVARLIRSADPFDGIPSWGSKLAYVLAGRGDPAATYGVLRSLFVPHQVDALVVPEHRTAARGTAFRAAAPGDPINAFAAYELSHYLRDTLLRDADVMSMAHGLELRVPLLDHKVVEATAAVPGRLKVSGHGNKPLLVRSVGTLPRSATDRPKQGFFLPLASWFRGPLRERIEALVVDAPPFLDRRATKRVWDAFLEGRRGVSACHVWSVAILSSFCQRHGACL